MVVVVPGDAENPPEDVQVKYRPGALTLEVFDTVQAQIAAGIEQDVAVTVLEPVLEWWDVEDDVLDAEGNPTGETVNVPCNAAGIKKVPLTFISLVMTTILEDAQPTPPNGAISTDTSELKGSLVALPSGTPTSEQPSTSTAHPGSS
jgi:hypothetical protein